MRQTAIIIGPTALCRRLEQQLGLLAEPPLVLGWVTPDLDDEAPIIGTLDALEAIVADHKPSFALVTIPAVMRDLVTQTRTRLRRLGVPDRFMPTLEDQLAGVGPRTHLDIEFAMLLDRPPKKMDAESVREVIDGRRVLITGAGGSIGSELARIVCQFNPEQIQLVERSENSLFEIDRQIAQRRPDLNRKAILHDVVDEAGTLGWFSDLQPNLIFHTAAHKHVPMMENHPAAAVDNNLFGTKSVADAAHAIGADRFVMISSDKAVNPVSIMGATKRLAELYVQYLHRRSDTGFSTVRFGNVLASSGSVLEVWSRQIADGGPVTVTDPHMTRYFMTIAEAASLVIQSAALLDEEIADGEVFLLDMGEPISIMDLAVRFVRLHGLEPVCPRNEDRMPNAEDSTFHVPRSSPAGTMPVAFTGIRPGEKLHEDLAFDAESMRPTRHPDINIWTLTPPNDRYVEMMIDWLRADARPDSPEALSESVRHILAESEAMQAA